MKTYSKTKEEAVKTAKWYVVDAADIPLGRLASEVAVLVRGKHKPTFTRHVSGGDFVVVLNAGKVRLTGNKLAQKKYYHHSLYPGGLRSHTAGELMRKSPEKVIRAAIQGMLPRGPLGRSMITKVKIYSGGDHPHKAQQPEVYKVIYAKAA